MNDTVIIKIDEAFEGGKTKILLQNASIADA